MEAKHNLKVRLDFINSISRQLLGDQVFELPVNVIAFVAQETIRSLSLLEPETQQKILAQEGYEPSKAILHHVDPEILKEIEKVTFKNQKSDESMI